MLHKTASTSKIRRITINKSSGKFECDGELFEAVEGKLLGFGSHSYRYLGSETKKFDIYLSDTSYGVEEIYQVQVGFYSWATFRIMNFLLSLKSYSSRITLVITKRKNNINILVREGKEYLQWKHKYNTLGFEGLSSVEKENLRNELIDTWYSELVSKKPFSLEGYGSDVISEEIEDDDNDVF